jgi:microcystin-dependent protein
MSILNVGTNVQISGTSRKITGVLGADGIIPPGAVIYTSANYYSNLYAKQIGNILTTGYLPCDGSSLRRTTYPELYDAIGTWFGIGTNEFGANSTFAVPDLRGEFIRCWDGPAYTSRDLATRSFGSPQSATRVYRSHYIAGLGYGNSLYDVDSAISADYDGNVESTTSANALRMTASSAGNSTGTIEGVRVRPRNIALLALIKY